MRTLFVTAGPPLPTDRGARVRDHALITRLAEKTPVSLMALVAGADEAAPLAALEDKLESVETAISPQALRPPPRLGAGGRRAPLAAAPFLAPGAVSAFRAAVAGRGPDLIQLEHWFLAPLIDALPAGARPAAVLSLHNVASAQYRSMAFGARRPGNRIKARLVAGVEKRFAPRFDAVVCVSERESALLAEIAPTVEAHVVPNAVDTEDLAVQPGEGEPGSILFVANFEYGPNRDAAEWLCNRVLPLPAVGDLSPRLRLVGPGIEAVSGLARAGVEPIGFVEDLAAQYRWARVAVAPIHSGGGTRLKILEAMAFGRPVVSTTIGCEGLGLEPGRHLMVADDAAGFAAALERVLGSEEARTTLRSGAREAVERHFDWSRSADALAAVHLCAVERAEAQGRNLRAATA